MLDDKWNTVTCARCGEKLDPYAALRSYADWWSELELKQTMADRATKDLYAETLRKLARRRAATDEEREEIKNLVAMKWSHDVETLRVATHRIERAINARRA
ncbi:MAG TPA: hypothetical protein VFI96_09175 [Longimicrobiaceae bacterium]|nr:hypothetical protein [Longimicrobiaceae bacterium]